MTNPLPFHTPFTLTVSAATSCGKSTLTAQILQNADWCFDRPVRKIFYFYSHHQELFEALEKRLPDITFHTGLPTPQLIEPLTDPTHHDVIVLDDLMRQCAGSEFVQDLFTGISHHSCISIIVLNQSIFFNGQHRRTQNLNSHYFLLLRNPMGVDQVTTFARQRFPGKSKAFVETYLRETSQSYGYLLVDSHPKSDPQYAVRTGILPGDELIVYKFP